MILAPPPAERPKPKRGQVAKIRPSAASSQRAVELARLEPEFIFSSAFSRPNAEREILGPLGDRVGESESRSANSNWKPSGAMTASVARMCQRKLLTPAEERLLFRRMNYAAYRTAVLCKKINARKPDADLIARLERLQKLSLDDRNEIVQANLRLVISIAKKFADANNAFDDLLSEGVETLIRAVEKFDFERGFRFSTYATQAVRRTLYRSVMNHQRDRQRFLPVDAHHFEDTPELPAESTLTEKRWHELRANFKRLLGRLAPREREIIRARFGLGRDGEVHTLQSLAHEMGICKERVRQLETRAIDKLRTLAAEIKLAPPEEV